MPVRVEVVEDEVYLLGAGIFAADGRDEIRKDVRRAIRCEVAIDLTRGHLQTGSEAARAVAYVLVLDALDTPGLGWLMGMFAFQRLNAGFLIDGKDDFAAFAELLSMQIEVDDVQHFGIEVRIRTVQPVMPTMRLDRNLVEKSPHGCPADGRDDAILDGIEHLFHEAVVLGQEKELDLEPPAIEAVQTLDQLVQKSRFHPEWWHGPSRSRSNGSRGHRFQPEAVWPTQQSYVARQGEKSGGLPGRGRSLSPSRPSCS